MSTIEQWEADYGGADTNIPQSSTAIPFPANTTTDLGEIIRDAKAVIRQESLNKGWWPDDYSADFVSNTTFRVSGDLRGVYPLGTAVRIEGDSTLHTFVRSMSFANSDTTVTVASGTVPANTVFAFFSAFLPSSNPSNVDAGYSDGVGGALPFRVTQWARFTVEGTATDATVYFARPEPNTSYRLLLQSVDVSAGPADNNSYVVTDIAKSVGGFVVTFQAAPGVGVTLYWEYAVVRGT